MAHASIQRVVKGDIIIERANGKKRMTPVTKVEFSACSSKGVHINRSACYDFNAVVELVDGEKNLGEMQDEMEEFEEDLDILASAGAALGKYDELAELLVKH